jgi:hypothetical protein
MSWSLSTPSWIYNENCQPIITSHLLSEKDRTTDGFVGRMDSILRWKLKYDEKQILNEFVQLARNAHQGQQRKWFFYDKEKNQYISDWPRRPYSTHVEWVSELVGHFASEAWLDTQKLRLISLVISECHDIIEDGDKVAKKALRALLLKYFPKEFVHMMVTLFALSHPEENISENIWIFHKILDPKHHMEFVSMRGNMLTAIDYANDIVKKTIHRRKEFQYFWSNSDTSPNEKSFRAPKDPNIDAILARELERKFSPYNGLNQEFNIDQNTVRTLYRFVEHCMYIWWLRNHQSLSWIQDDQKFIASISHDLASMIQVLVYQHVSQDEDTFGTDGLPYTLIVIIKLLDQLYNLWDNEYLTYLEKWEKQEAAFFKAKILLFRAQVYQEVMDRMVGINSWLSSYFEWTIENLLRTLHS